MKDLTMFEISVLNPVTRETLKFLGNGKTVPEAVADGIKNLQEAFRPDSSGGAKPSIGIGVAGRVHVVTPDGRHVLRSLLNFGSEASFQEGEK